MKNNDYYGLFRSQLKLDLSNEFGKKINDELVDFYEKNKDLPEGEFTDLLFKNFSLLLNSNFNNQRLKLLKGIYNILTFFLVVSIAYILFAVMIAQKANHF